MKTINKILLIISIILGALTIAALLTIKSINVTETGLLINFYDGSGYYLEKTTKEEIKTDFKITNILYESSDSFYLDKGEIGIKFTNGSWAIINEEKNTYTFQPVELGDWDYNNFNSIEDFKKCINTYIPIKNTEYY